MSPESSPYFLATHYSSGAPTSMLSIPTRTSSAKRTKPSNVQTSFLPSSSTPLPASAISTSSVTSGSLQGSPVMSPDATQLTTKNSSLQASPEALHGRDADVTLSHFQLPDPIVSRKSSQSALTDALSASKSPGFVRRLSNRASKFAAGRRRQSSITSKSRDRSSGPIMRRRSDSTNTAPDGARGNMISNSDSDVGENNGECSQVGLGIESTREFAFSTSATASITGSSVMTTPATPLSPMVPSVLLQGTKMIKVTRKRKKLLTFVLESEAAKVTWDKNKPAKSFYIDDIKAIRIGVDVQNYRQEFGISSSDASRFFSICYAVPDRSKGRSQKFMHLIAEDEQSFNLWTTTLDAVSKHRQDRMASLATFPDAAVRAYWKIEMAKQLLEKSHPENEETIDITGFQRLCRSLHIHCSPTYLQQKFSQADINGSGRLSFEKFKGFLKLMKKREEIHEIYQDRNVDSEKGMTQEEFISFLREVQHENVDADKVFWENVFNKYSRRSRKKQEFIEGDIPRINESALADFITSSLNSPVENAPQHYTLDRPFNEYFISSSHNTYLLGRQVAGQSSVEAYITALNRGCRCVEIDCWNGNDGQPVVMHGRTLTSQISFADVMSTISRYAFVKSSFPLWISLEVHCSAQQQGVMARIIKETCGSALVTKPIDDGADHLPSPSQLMNRILIKVKKPQLLDDTTLPEQGVAGRSRGNSLNSPLPRPVVLDSPSHSFGSLPPSAISKPPRISGVRRRHTGYELQESPSSTSDSEGFSEDRKNIDRSHKTSKIVKVLGELGVYSAGLKFCGFDDPDSKTYNHIFSFMEATFDKNSKTQEEKRAIARHNMRYMMRVYPNGWRFNSSNFDPLEFWRRGVQMVALNWQTYDLGMQMNDAMFAAGTAQSGYVLKPSEHREIKMLPSVPEEAGADHVKRERKNVNFSIDVISAQQLMRPRNLPTNRSVDPYIEVEVCHSDDKSKESKGVVGEGGLDASSKDRSSGLGAPHRRRTHIVPGNGFNPVFNKNCRKLNFALTTKYPDLIFVRFSVRYSPEGSTYSDRGQPLATYCAKLSTLKQGYRTLPLFDGQGDQFLLSTLFCKVNVEPVTSVYVNGPESSESVSVLKTISRTVWNRTPMSPRVPSDNGQA